MSDSRKALHLQDNIGGRALTFHVVGPNDVARRFCEYNIETAGGMNVSAARANIIILMTASLAPDYQVADSLRQELYQRRADVDRPYVLSSDWLLQSLKEGVMCPPKDFELDVWSEWETMGTRSDTSAQDVIDLTLDDEDGDDVEIGEIKPGLAAAAGTSSSALANTSDTTVETSATTLANPLDVYAAMSSIALPQDWTLPGLTPLLPRLYHRRRKFTDREIIFAMYYKGYDQVKDEQGYHARQSGQSAQAHGISYGQIYGLYVARNPTLSGCKGCMTGQKPCVVAVRCASSCDNNSAQRNYITCYVCQGCRSQRNRPSRMLCRHPQEDKDRHLSFNSAEVAVIRHNAANPPPDMVILKLAPTPIIPSTSSANNDSLSTGTSIQPTSQDEAPPFVEQPVVISDATVRPSNVLTVSSGQSSRSAHQAFVFHDLLKRYQTFIPVPRSDSCAQCIIWRRICHFRLVSGKPSRDQLACYGCGYSGCNWNKDIRERLNTSGSVREMLDAMVNQQQEHVRTWLKLVSDTHQSLGKPQGEVPDEVTLKAALARRIGEAWFKEVCSPGA